jgi:hypothetical protein
MNAVRGSILQNLGDILEADPQMGVVLRTAGIMGWNGDAHDGTGKS